MEEDEPEPGVDEAEELQGERDRVYANASSQLSLTLASKNGSIDIYTTCP